MIPITLDRDNSVHWLKFGSTELWRILKALMVGAQGRERAVTRHVERTAREGDPESVIASMDAFAKERRFLMNVGEEKGDILIDQLVSVRANRVLELGAYCGYSAVLMGAQLQRTGGQLVSIEASSRNAELARRVVAHAGLTETVDIQVGSASESIRNLQGTFDLVFIDHWKDDYLSDLRQLEELGLLRPGARIVADNVGIFSKTLAPYLDYVRTSEHMESTHFATRMEYSDDIADGVEVSVWRGPRGQLAA
ncbi:MAG: O-methyltransferase [Myxococcota bacterium]